MYGALMARSSYERIFDVVGTKILFSDYSTLVVATPLISTPGVQSISLFWDREKEDDATIVHLLSSIPDFDWNKTFFSLLTPLTLREKVGNFIAKAILGDGVLKPTKTTRTHLYSMTSQSEIEISLPEGLEIRAIGEEDAQHLLDHWDYKSIHTIDCYNRLIRMVPGMGVYQIKDQPQNKRKKENIQKDKKETSTSEQESSSKSEGASADSYNAPVAWSQLSTFGFLTNTFTLPQYRRQGLATAVTLALAHKTIEDTGIASVNIIDDNEVSRNMHEKLGFTRQFAMGFQYFESSVLSLNNKE